MQFLGVSHYGFCSLRRDIPQVDVIEGLGVLAIYDGSKSFDDVVLMAGEVRPDLLLVVDGHPVADAVREVEEEGETERVESQVSGSDGL